MAKIANDEIAVNAGNVNGVNPDACKCCDGSMLRAVKSGDTKKVAEVANKKGWSCLDACIDRENGDTPLMVALKASDAEMSTFLYKNGADQFNKNNDGINAIDLSKEPLDEFLQTDILQIKQITGAPISP